MASSRSKDGESRRSRQPSWLKTNDELLAVVATRRTRSTPAIAISRDRSRLLTASWAGLSRLGSTRSSVELISGSPRRWSTKERSGRGEGGRGVCSCCLRRVGRPGGGGHHGLGSGVGPVDVGGDRTLTDDQDPVCHAEHLGQLGGDHQDRQTLAGELGEQAVHL